MDWGHPKSEAVYPTRKKKEISLFDVKEFTKKKKSEKIKNSLSEKGPGMGTGNSFGSFGDNNPLFSQSWQNM